MIVFVYMVVVVVQCLISRDFTLLGISIFEIKYKPSSSNISEIILIIVFYYFSSSSLSLFLDRNACHALI